jgi:hypothetical protein
MNTPVISIDGGGSLFPWYIGYLKYVVETFDTDGTVGFVGGSTGAFLAVFAACGVDLDAAVDVALQMSTSVDSVHGLLYVWGNLIRQWMDGLLPEDAALRCNGRVKIIATEVPWFRIRCISRFSSKEDVISAAMASSHLPFILDGKFAFRHNDGRWYIDGCVWDVILGEPNDFIKRGVYVSYTDDVRMMDAGMHMMKIADVHEAQCIRIIDPETAKCLGDWGYTYARGLDASGFFDATLGPFREGRHRH